MSPRLLPGC